ncbi:MAG: hypothetical protein M3P39_08355 [Actinomycetota bacterium]|nr:hypothetical protein [Actinomycetota bacterium]
MPPRPTEEPTRPATINEAVARRILRGVIHEKALALSQRRTPVTPPAAAAALVAPIAH